MILLRLYWEYFKTGLFAVGGGLATIPFLRDMGARTGWFTDETLTTMIAVSESTPGPIGVNMATYVGYEIAGISGVLAAALGLITPCFLVILIVCGFLQKFRQSTAVNAIFSGLRPASTALIAVSGLNVALSVLVRVGGFFEHTFSIHWPSVIVAVIIFLCMQQKKLKNLHPVAYIAAAAAAGIFFQF